jgi:hypothetical protein
MATMTIRTTVAFDPASAARLERLAIRWGVSKSETLRRALEDAEKEDSNAASGEPDFQGMTPLKILEWLDENPSPQIPGGWGGDPHRELSELREVDAMIEDEREFERPSARVAEDAAGTEA